MNEKPKKTIYGYLPYWSVENINYLQLDKLTDVSYFGLAVEADGTLRQALSDGSTDPAYAIWLNSKDLQKLITKCKKQGVRFSLTLISHEDTISDKVLECETCWETLFTAIAAQLKAKAITDINLNFEYSEFTDPQKAQAYTKLTNFLNTKLDNQFGDSKVVVATFGDAITKPRVTDVENLAAVADALFIMGYDFHRPDSDTAGPVAPIGGAGTKTDYDITTMLKDYLTKSPPNKLILGVPYYGYNWVIAINEDYAKRLPGNDSHGYSQSQTYADVNETILKVKPTILWDAVGQVPYFTYTSPDTGALRQVYYEDTRSLKIKYDLAKGYGLAGVGIWALGYDAGYTDLWELLGQEF